MNLGRGSKRKGRGKVVSHESKTWFKEERNGGKYWGKLYSINLGCGSKREGRGKVLVQTGYPAPTLVEKGKQ